MCGIRHSTDTATFGLPCDSAVEREHGPPPPRAQDHIELSTSETKVLLNGTRGGVVDAERENCTRDAILARRTGRARVRRRFASGGSRLITVGHASTNERDDPSG